MRKLFVRAMLGTYLILINLGQVIGFCQNLMTEISVIIGRGGERQSGMEVN